MFFEKILRILCPCYYARSDESELLCSTYEDHKDEVSENPQTTARFIEVPICYRYETDFGTESYSAVDYWGGSFDLIRPQPLYAMPTERTEAAMENEQLLKPPLYWKKTMKNFGNKGPPVIESRKKRRTCLYHKREVVSSTSQVLVLKHSETVADVRSISSDNKKVRWLRSQSLYDLPARERVPSLIDDKFVPYVEGRRLVGNRREEEPISFKEFAVPELRAVVKHSDDGHSGVKKFRVIPDISYGVIVLSAAYHLKKKLFLLKLERLEDLALKGRGGCAYSTVVKIAVSPSDKYLKSTKVLKKSTCPEVKEDFSFSVKENSGKVLKLSVFDAVCQNSFNAIGHALLSLDGVSCRHPKRFRMKLYRHTQPHITPGNLALSLGYRREENKFTVLVDKAKNLTLQRDKSVKLNTYVKATLYSYGSKLKSKKSVLVANSKDPIYNSIFTFDVTDDDIDDLLVVISVRLKSFIKDSTIGRVILGPFFITDQKKLTPWGRVFLKQEFVSHWFRMYL